MEQPFLPSPSLSVDSGQLCLAGMPARQLAEKYGTPLVVLLEDDIRANCREYRQRLKAYPRSRVYYASKAFLTTGFCRLLVQEQMGLDVVSAGELHTALAAGFPAENILLHGNAKDDTELELALKSGVGRIVLDNQAEIEALSRIAQRLGKDANVFLRITPGIQPETHAAVQTGQVDSKFGFNLEGGAALAAAERVLACPRLKLIGLHCHIGSQILEHQPFALAVRIMLEFYTRLQRELDAPLDELNLGGGLGVRYQPEQLPPAIEEHTTRLAAEVLDVCADLELQPPVLCDEPGRSIAANAGVTLYTVQSVKQIPGVRNYVSVDGGMTDNPRFALYGSKHGVLLADRLAEQAAGRWAVSGKCCESGDMLAKDVPLPLPQRGDLLALLSTGAYTYSMASNYNRVARPAVLLVGSNGTALLARRESLDDLISLDETPDWLA